MNKINNNLSHTVSSALALSVVAIGLMLSVSIARATSSCSINSAGLTFPNYETFSNGPRDSLGSVSVLCTNMGPVATTGDTVALKIGGGSYGTVTDRKMASGTDQMRYAIYTSAEHNQNWGDGTAVPTLPTGPLAVGASKNMTFNLYGRIAPLQNVRAGSYSDQVMITVTP